MKMAMKIRERMHDVGAHALSFDKLNLENKYVITGAALLTFLTGFAATELVFRLLFGSI